MKVDHLFSLQKNKDLVVFPKNGFISADLRESASHKK